MNHDKRLEQYKTIRYLRHAKDHVLVKRLEDIGTNLWSTDRDGNVAPIRNQTHRTVLLKLYADTLYEQYFRRPADIHFNEADLRKQMTAGFVTPMLKTPIDFEPTCLAKFGQRKHIIESFNKGIFRIAPADSYQDPSLNSAQKDDELHQHTQTPNEQIESKLLGLDEHGGKIKIQAKNLELFRFMRVPNFYVWCCGLGYDARLFTEFNADAALIVKNISTFRKKLTDAVRSQLPSAAFESREIDYYDPYTSLHSQITPVFSKHIRYLYQNEYRFSWKPKDSNALKPFFVEIGSLHDIATVLELA